MSHFNSLRSKLTDAELLKLSLRDLGMTVQTNAEVRGAGCQRVRADIVAVLSGSYDLGWTQNADGSFNLVADLWGVAQTHNMANLLSSINQRYAVNKTMAQVQQRPGLQNAKIQVMCQQ